MTTPVQDVRLGLKVLGDKRQGGVRSFIGATRSADPQGLLVLSVLAVVLPLLTTAVAWCTKVITDGVIAGDTSKAVLGLVGLSVAQGMPRALSSFQQMRMNTVQERTGTLIRLRINEMLLRVPGIEHHERPATQDQLMLLRSGLGQLIQGAFLVFDVAAAVVQLVVSAVLLAAVSPWLLLVAPLGLTAVGAAVIVERWGTLAALVTAERQRLASRLGEMIRYVAPHEIRVAGAQRELEQRVDRIRREANAKAWRANAKGQLVMTASTVVITAGVVGSVVFVASESAKGRATAGDVVLTTVLAQRLADSVASFADQFQRSLGFLRAAARFGWLADYVESASARTADPLPAPTALRDGIRLEGLRFTYPGTEAPVLDGVDLHLPAGSTVALVGDNGAGKTTLVKLLCGFYRPTSGHILVEGVDLHALDLDAWRARVTACFQDHFTPQLTAQQAVGYGEPAYVDDRDAVTLAVQRASATAVVDGLPSGYDQQLGKLFDTGVQLSGGQWQQLALARSMMREEPLLVLLDEPTAALDPEAEHRLFTSYAAAAREAAFATGGITLLVSHRFSTVRTADLIVVIEDGRVVEAGSHTQLMAQQGHYAQMYDVQARAYR